MAERETPPNYNETTQPQNPPNSMLSKQTRRAALGSYLGPVVALFLIVGLGLIYWSNRGPSKPDLETSGVGVGTTGENGPGALNPRPTHKTTRDELEFRGGSDTPLTRLGDLAKDAIFVSGRRVDVNDVEVESAQGTSFWVRDGGDRVEVVAPAGSSLPSKGAHVHVVGTVEGAGGERPHIRASSVTSK